MKTLNFTAVEILQSLLDKSKIQTIRPAWKEVLVYPKPTKIKQREGYSKQYPEFKIIDKSCFKVRDKVKLVWNQRSKFLQFCGYCGNGEHSQLCVCTHCAKQSLFSKILGIVEITEVFKIEMGECPVHQMIGEHFYIKMIKGGHHFKNIIDYIAKLDGFSSTEQMFRWFDKKYDLSVSKEFWVYRWKWD